MTPDQIATEYLRREAEANAKPEGADVHAIIEGMCEEFTLKRQTVVQAVLDHTISGAC